MSPPKPKVLLISTVHPPNDPRIVFKVAASLQNHYDVTCALPNATPETLAGVQFIKLPFYPKLTDRLWRVHPLVIWKLLETKPDVVQVFVAELLPIAFIFSWFGAKIIYEVQENLPKKFHTKKINNEKLFQYFFRCFDGLARRFFYLVFTEYAYLKDYSNLKKPHRVVANFASLPLLNPMWQPYRAGNNSQPAEFLYVGVVSTDRCIQTMIDALALVKVSHPDVIMHLFGTVNFGMENLEKLENYELVHKNMVFYGYTDLRVAEFQTLALHDKAARDKKKEYKNNIAPIKEVLLRHKYYDSCPFSQKINTDIAFFIKAYYQKNTHTTIFPA